MKTSIKPSYCMHAQAETQRSFISATAISSMVACFLMGALANMPLALAPGMVGPYDALLQDAETQGLQLKKGACIGEPRS